jgi:hypothetical protein
MGDKRRLLQEQTWWNGVSGWLSCKAGSGGVDANSNHAEHDTRARTQLAEAAQSTLRLERWRGTESKRQKNDLLTHRCTDCSQELGPRLEPPLGKSRSGVSWPETRDRIEGCVPFCRREKEAVQGGRRRAQDCSRDGKSQKPHTAPSRSDARNEGEACRSWPNRLRRG